MKRKLDKVKPDNKKICRPSCLEEQRELLFSLDVDKARGAISYIAKFGSLKDRKLLIKALGVDSPGVVESAQNAIVELNRKDLIRELFKYSSSSEFDIKLRANAFDTLKKIAAKNGNFLIDYYEYGNNKYERLIAELIRYGKFFPKNFPVKALSSLANSSDEITRANAIESIGILNLKIPGVLIKGLKGSFFVAASAIFSIGETKLRQAFPKLRDMFLETSDSVLRNLILESLAKIGGEETLDFLLFLIRKNNNDKIDKIYILKSLYKICMMKSCKKAAGTNKSELYGKLTNSGFKISIFSIDEYEDKESVDSILCYYSLLNHKKSLKIFNFLVDFYNRKDDIDDIELGFIREIFKKVARPKYIVEYILSLNKASDFQKINLLISVLSEISSKDLFFLLKFYKDKKFFPELKTCLLNNLINITKDTQNTWGKKNASGLSNLLLQYASDGNGNVRKASAVFFSRCKNAEYLESLFGILLNETYPDVINAFIESISSILSLKGNKNNFLSFAENLNSDNQKILEFTLRILENSNVSLSRKEISDLYLLFRNFRNIESKNLRLILARALRKFDLMNHLKETAFLLEEEDEMVKFNYLESLLVSGNNNPVFYADIIASDCHSEGFKFRIVELIERIGGKKSFDALAPLLRKESSKMLKIAILKALNNIDNEMASEIISSYNYSKDKDLRNYSSGLIKRNINKNP